MPSSANTDSDAQASRNLIVRFAESKAEILQAQKLRYRVFAEEMGARLTVQVPGVDEDHYDAFCRHLIVCDVDKSRVVGTYRVLTPQGAIDAGGYYSANEFDLTPLMPYRDKIVEIGRSCIDVDYRSGAVITMLWTELTRFLVNNQYSYLMGCGSILLEGEGHNAANVYNQLRQKHLTDEALRVTPRNPMANIEQLINDDPVELPPLIKGYLRVGAKICGEPSIDHDFNTADVLLLISIEQINRRYARHFFSKV